MTSQAESPRIMSQNKPAFTPGPWITARADRTIGIFSTGNVAFFVAKAYGPDKKANAQLIEAYPDLYEALESLLNDCEEYVRINNLHDDDGSPANTHSTRRARAALSKARGEAQ